MNEDTTCICGPLHSLAHHQTTHQHAPFTEDCNDGCCIVDACLCDTFRSVANEAERQGMQRAAELYNS